MVYSADIAAPGADRVLSRARGLTSRCSARRRAGPRGGSIPTRPVAGVGGAAARRSKVLRRLEPELALELGTVTVDDRAGFRVEFRCVRDVAELELDALQALVSA